MLLLLAAVLLLLLVLEAATCPAAKAAFIRPFTVFMVSGLTKCLKTCQGDSRERNRKIEFGRGGWERESLRERKFKRE